MSRVWRSAGNQTKQDTISMTPEVKMTTFKTPSTAENKKLLPKKSGNNEKISLYYRSTITLPIQRV
jgi:hypothetical protein